MKKFMLSCFALCAFAAFAGLPTPLLVPDYDRDGDIGATDHEKALAGQKFTIWLNDDDDDDGTDSGAEAGDTNNDLHDVPGGNDDKDFADDHVNGRCDLLDFFPVLINVKEVVGWDGMTWKLSSESVNVVFTGLDEHKAGSFHTQEVKALDGNTPLYRAAVTNLTEDGVELPNGFLVNGRGVFLIEGAALADGGITLRATKEGGDPVEVTMRLDVVNVEDMYGWMNLRPEAAVSSKPPYQPPAISRDSQRHFVLVHGYNTNHEEARGNAAEFYKKLWQSGSDAMFTAVEWKGNQSQVEIFGLNLTPNYHVNVENAFLAARPFADACAKLPGEKILVAHSLGNMLVSSAIKDYGLDYTKYVMLNAAVACEAFDASAYDEDMVDDDWLGDEVKDVGVDKLTNHLDRASRWYRNFAGKEYDPYEYRRKLAWRGRFANLPRTVNYYSPTDNILINPDPHEPDPDKIIDRNDPDIYNKVRALLAKKLVDGKSIGRGGTRKTGFGFWSFSEKLKGTWLLDTVNDVLTNLLGVAQADGYRREGGWGENIEYDPDPKKPFDPANTHFTPFLDARMKTKGMLDILPAETERLRAQHLADAIPAESFAAGANEVTTLENVNEESFIGENQEWPLYEGEEGGGTKTNLWNHSAFREVAFYHTSKFYTSLVEIGKPRIILDTDLGSSMDDLFTVDLAARMHKAGKLDLMAVMMDRPDYSDDEHKGEFLTFADRYLASLGFGDLPIGRSIDQTKQGQPVFNPYWTLIYSNNLTGVGLLLPTNRTPEEISSLTNAVALYRRLLREAPDKSVVICSTGFLTNLDELMRSKNDEYGELPGTDLIAQKVKELRIMGGCFDDTVAPDGKDGAEYNFAGDPGAAQRVVHEWPTPVILSPWEVGLKLEYEPKDVLADFPAGTFDSVIRSAYTYWPEPLEQEHRNRLWDPMTVLPLTEGETLVPLSSNGVVTVDDKGRTTFTLDATSNRCYQVASNMNAAAVMNRYRTICRTGNPSVAVIPISEADPGIDYNGSVLSVKIDGFDPGSSYEKEDLFATLTVAGETYGNPVWTGYDELSGILTLEFTVPDDKVTAGNAYEGEVKVGFRNDTLGENVVYTRKRQFFVQGRHEKAGSETDWFNETDLVAPTNYVPEKVGKGDMPERCKAVVETTFLFEAPSEATDDPPGESQNGSPDNPAVTNFVQGAVRIVSDGADGYKFQYYACVGKTNEDSFVRGWWDFNAGNETEVKPILDRRYTVQMEGHYFEDARREENTLVIWVKEGDNGFFHKQFVGNIINSDGGQGGTTRLHSVEFLGDGEIPSLVGNYYTNTVNATLARVGGTTEYATVAEAVAAARAGDQDVRLLHKASWKPKTDDIGNSVRFLNKNWLNLDLSGLPLGTRAKWTDVDGNDGTLELVPDLPIGVCSWTWHSSMTNVLAQMAADGRYNGMQLALAPWLGIDSMSLYFGDQEGKEVWNFIKAKIASGELNVMSTMINFPKEDYTTLTSITNTQGYMYGVAEEWADADEQWASNLFYTAEAARLTKELGVKTLTTESGFICINENLMYDRVSNICEICKSYGVDFLIESGPQHSQYMTNLLTRLNAAGFDNVGVNFDPGDTELFEAEDPVESYRAMKKWIKQIHVKDCMRKGGGGRYAWNEDCPWGEGIVSRLDFGGCRTFLNAVKRDFPDGINILYERLSSDPTLMSDRAKEVKLAMNRIIDQMTEPEGKPNNPWSVGAERGTVLACVDGKTVVFSGHGGTRDFIESAAPWGTDVTSAEFGAQVTNIGANAFKDCNLTSLMMRGNPPAIGEGNDFSEAEIHVRADALDKFAANEQWKVAGREFEPDLPVPYDYTNVKTLAPFLHEIYFTEEYDSPTDKPYTAVPDVLPGFSCTAVRNGNFYGRNMDYFLSDVSSFVVHMPAKYDSDMKKIRLASVGVASQNAIREDGVTNGLYTASYDTLPEIMYDGINECGVIINNNVVPRYDCGTLTGTNPDGDPLHVIYLIRYVLDHATNALHAVELIKSRDLVGMAGPEFQLHWMVADPDPKETYVVEVINSKVVARKMDINSNFNWNWDNKNKCAVDDDYAATNGWCRDDYPVPYSNDVTVAMIDEYYTPHADGVERFCIMREHYDEGKTFEGMFDLLQRVQYTKLGDKTLRPLWLADLAGGDFLYAEIYDVYKTNEAVVLDFYSDWFATNRYVFAHKEEFRKKNSGEWQTVHNTTYDFEKRMFRIAVQEDCDHTFDIWLDRVPGSRGNPWLVGATTNDTVTAWTNGTALVVEGRGAMKDFETVGPWGTGITDVDFGAQVTNFGANAFAGCTLTTLTMHGNPPALGGNDLLGVTIVVRKDALAKFVDDPDWNAYAAKFESVPVCYDYEHIKTLAPFLHEVWFDDYTFDEKGETLAGVEMFSCSSVRNGNFIGRNFDFFLDDKPEFVVHVAANPEKGRLASVAMAMHTGMREDGVTNGQYTASYDLLPNRTLDGINECGVAINQNVVAYDPEVAAGVEQEFSGTNPGAPDLNSSFVTRMVLDRATNAAHAVELIKSYNIFGISVSGDILHYMISDSKETYVVEIITNTVVARHFEMMTNFAINWDNEHARALTDADNKVWTRDHYPEPSNLVVSKGSFVNATNELAKYYARHAEGVERFVRLRDHYDEVATFEDMEALMRRAQYSQASTFETQPYWYSDRCSVGVDKQMAELGYPGIANTYMLYGLKYYKEEADPEGVLTNKLDEILETYFMAYERDCLEHKDAHRKDDCGVWLTVHNTTYDISNRMFRVVVQEDYDHKFDIYLSDRPVEQPVTPGEALGPYRTYEKATNVAEKAVLKPSAEVEEVLTTEEVRKDYKSKFDFAVAYKSGEESGWYVAAMLTAAGSNDLARSANTVMTNINLAAIAALVGETTTSMTLMGGITGFYYSLHVGDAVTNIAPDANEKNLNVLCGKKEIGKVTFPEVKKPSDAAGFFTVGASAGRGGVIDTALPGGW